MFRLLLKPAALRFVQPSLAVRSFASSSFSRLPAKSTLPTSIKATTGSGQGGKADKLAAAEAKVARLQAKLVKAGLAKSAVKKPAAKKSVTKERKVAAAAKVAKTKLKAKAVKEKAKAVKDKAKALKDKAKVKATTSAKKVSTKHVVKAPRAPQNSWQIFLQDATESKRKELPEGAKLPLAAKFAAEIAPLYRQLGSEELSTLQTRAAAERAAYPAKLQEWMASLSPEMIKEENLVRFRRRKLGLGRARNLHRADEPKRPQSAYFAYCADVREGREAPNALVGIESDIRAQSKVLSAGWKALTEAEREAYRNAHLDSMKTFTEEKKAYDAKYEVASA